MRRTGTTTAILLAATLALAGLANADLLLNGQANQLDAYDLDDEPPSRSVFIPRASQGGKDLNAEICELTDVNGRRLMLLGEDSGQPAAPAGWGVFDLRSKVEIGKVVADYGTTAGPENYGCAIEADANGLPLRIFVTQAGDGTFTSSDGQLILFFPSSPSLDAVYGRRTADEVCPAGDCTALDESHSDWCILDGSIRTAGGIARDADGNLYVGAVTGTLGPGLPGPGTILRYRPPFPASADDCFEVEPEVFIQDFQTATPVAIAAARNADGSLTGTWYVTSLLVLPAVNEYDASGTFLRTVLPPGFGTPFGLTVGPEGTLYVTDLGVGLDPAAVAGNPTRLGLGPVGGEGSVLRVRFEELPGPIPDPFRRMPLVPEVLGEGLSFPDGLAVIADPSDGTCTANSGCASGEYCSRSPGDCTGSGTCEPRPQACPDVYLPVCGCDGVTYGNDCEARAAGVTPAHGGPCP